jgi:ubiquinone/menaquinone biosynthesis C-methylase UbiE
MPASVDRVNYDQIAASYDRRFAHGESSSLHLLQRLAWEAEVERILEVGCGTGHWLINLRNERSGAPVPERIGLDLSSGMLEKAHNKDPGLPLVCGEASHLPFTSQAYDLVYCVNALHHFERPQAFIAEANRVMQPGGRLAVIGLDVRSPGTAWYIYQYFEGTLETDLRRFPALETISDWMAAAGFQEIAWNPAEHIWAPMAGRLVLEDPFLDKESTSQLTLLSQAAYQAGLQKIKDALNRAEAARETILFPVNLSIMMVTGQTARL